MIRGTTPTFEFTLPTRSKTMRDDVRIDMIPTREIPNAAGGVTFIVGG